MNILIKRKTRPPLTINSEIELTKELKKVSKYFKQINDLNRHLFAYLQSMVFSTPSEFYAKLKEILGNTGSGTKVNIKKLVERYGWSQVDAEEWDFLFKTRMARHVTKTGKDKDKFYKQNSHFSIAFWLKRGFSEQEAKERISKFQKQMGARVTPERRKSTNLLSLEYEKYIGLTLEEKKEIIKKQQRLRSVRCIEFWIKQGFTEEQGRALIGDCQRKWMEGKTKEEIKAINSNKTGSLINFKTLWTDKFDRPGILYLIEFGNELFKIGITCRPRLEKRYTPALLNEAKIHLNLKVENITKAFCLEQIILRKFKFQRIVSDHGYFGRTEVFKLENPSEILYEINLLNTKSTTDLREYLFSLINTETKL